MEFIVAMATLLSTPSWNDLSLVRALDGAHFHAIEQVYNYVAPLLSTRPAGLEEFTDHNLQHSTRIVERIGYILPADVQLNQSELYLLLLAALLHDAGLWTPKAEAAEIFGRQEFRAYCRKWDNKQLEVVDRLLTDPNQKWLGELGVQRLVATYHRESHADRLASVVLSADSFSGNELRTLIGTDYVEPVVAISIAHSWEKERILKDWKLNDIRRGGDRICLRFLAELLRLGDLLDLGEGRVSTLLWSYLVPMNAVSEAHWRKEMTLKVEDCNPNQIRVVGHFDVSSDGAKAADAYRLACDWLKMLECETEFAISLSNRLSEEFKVRLKLGRLEIDRAAVSCNGLAWGENASFSLSRDRVMQLLSNELYADRTVFMRELIQNSVDATRAQMIRDRRAGLVSVPERFTDEEPWNWPQELTADPRYEITLRESVVDNKGETCVVFSVSDNGIGMSLSDIQEFFLQVGKSFYTTDQFQREFRHTPISRFGIGFLSCLSVADHIEVTTRHRDESVGMKLDIRPPSDFFVITPDAEAEFGTTVTLRIRPIVLEELKERRVPYGEIDIIAGSDNNLTTMCMGWGIFIEFALATEYGRIVPRRPLTYSPSPLMAGDKRDSVAIVVRSKRGHELAVGRAFYLILGSNRLPFFHSTTPNNFVLASIRGIGLSCDAFCTVREQIQIILDFRRIPPETFTAGRTIRWRNHFISLVGDYVSARLRSRSLELLENQSKELAIIWKIFQDRSMPRSTRAEMLPVRTNDPTVTWQRWEEIESKYPRIVIVPFHIAWKGPWSLDVPCVGIPNGQIGSLNYDSNIGRTPIWDCNLVTVAGRCTGYLWPPAANVGGLELLSHRTTYLHDCLRSWPISITHKTFQTSVPIYPQLIQRGDLPSYDRDANPWEQFGILEYAHANDGSVTSQTATTMLDNSAPCNLSLETLEIDLDGTEDWE